MANLLRSSRLRAACLALTGAFLAACADAPTAPATASAPRLDAAVNSRVAGTDAVAASATASMLACASTTADSASAVIGPRGGSVGVAGSSLVVTPGAVRTPTTFTFVVPASPYVQVEIHAAGADHYEFARPAAVSISYARCADSELPASRLGAWWIDSATLQTLGVMAGFDDRAHRRVTFITDHLSGYAVVY